jgi:hypothetical protein
MILILSSVSNTRLLRAVAMGAVDRRPRVLTILDRSLSTTPLEDQRFGPGGPLIRNLPKPCPSGQRSCTDEDLAGKASHDPQPGAPRLVRSGDQDHRSPVPLRADCADVPCFASCGVGICMKTHDRHIGNRRQAPVGTGFGDHRGLNQNWSPVSTCKAESRPVTITQAAKFDDRVSSGGHLREVGPNENPPWYDRKEHRNRHERRQATAVALPRATASRRGMRTGGITSEAFGLFRSTTDSPRLHRPSSKANHVATPKC